MKEYSTGEKENNKENEWSCVIVANRWLHRTDSNSSNNNIAIINYEVEDDNDNDELMMPKDDDDNDDPVSEDKGTLYCTDYLPIQTMIWLVCFWSVYW